MRPPAYGRALIEKRRTGPMPWAARLIVGDRWTSQTRHPWRLLPETKVALKPSDWRPRGVDWGCLRGLHVAIEERSDLPLEWVLALAAEVSAVAAPVTVEADFTHFTPMDIADLAWGYRDWTRTEAGLPVWPRWWSDAQARDYAERAQAWGRELWRSVDRWEGMAA